MSQANENDEILFVGWQFHVHLFFTGKFGSNQDFATFLQAARARKARVRLLAIPLNRGAEQVAEAKDLKVEALIDDQLPAGASSHHQKAVFVGLKSSSHLFIGGIDVARERGGWFDVQVEIIGRGADLGRKTLEERWESVKPPLGGVSATQRPLPKPSADAHQVQFVRTYPPFPKDTTGWKRTYAKDGEHTYYSLLCHAIANAKESIYLEEQFFQTMGPAPTRNNPVGGSSPRRRSDVPDVPDTIERLLVDRVANGVKLVVVAANSAGPPRLPDPKARSALVKMLANLKNPPVLLQTKSRAEKVFHEGQFVTTLFKDFVHSKTWIFDDRGEDPFVLVGSANLWPQSLVSVSTPAESEFGVGFASKVDGTSLGFPKVSFARAMRIKMWERLRQSKDPNYTFPRNASASLEDEIAELRKPIGGVDPFEEMKP
ncbi:hypothetical protein CQY20_30310 [Mycolicibacterium agri]|uniref:PLD phosphodiesterase domain-containing protein n=1 Tax=Mycolicibacterium agri TaxID=36811 RepID=A0A2A7MQW4_MYCAG|nr:hypothetical protein [Mycolicibacterium agri]PEG33538.1 hypothetical protein CQY20_30310 [Mycolicibacterium agri]GFG49023.1 hypothetical protein MAGR_04640 [Mycolicibacterium agri]